MEANIAIREEAAADIDAIHDLTVAAFREMEHSSHTEQFIVAELRAAGALAVSLVAEREGRVVGHIAFSPVSVSDDTTGWYGLGPVSVLPEYQRQGIGKALIKEGLARLQAIGAQGCCLVGHPEYYVKFGFRNVPGLVYEGVPLEYFFVLPFGERVPQGTVNFHEAFLADGQS
ncbi:N-acetyltransferase [Halomonas sp. MCCC 1A11036]|uniref:N-acetyltransferase n=1 Tax=Billgrantia zhangzhouensis TaxID=2733481 RepID=A0ABS9ADX4_9GAMM|nr:N-acetyltransferase [Halomonas zhangzhouensis]MCE8019927.1 N-acetyltransferase [Halomonas zhangzhouensis]